MGFFNMTSAIDPTKPTSGKAYTADVRANFAVSAMEISDLQSTIVALQSQIAALQNDISNLQSQNAQQQADITTLKSRRVEAENVVTANPPNTNSTEFVMAVDGVSFTPDFSTRGIVIVDGQLGNTSNAGESELQLCFGAGAPPSAGTLLSNTNGVVLGAPVSMLATRSGDYDPFALSGLLNGLSAKSQYWFGVGFRALNGTATLSQVSMLAFELLDPIP
ncbi:MAG TPA: hypothetical protein VGD41_07390 [Pyrinomonadaceae bacterium]